MVNYSRAPPAAAAYKCRMRRLPVILGATVVAAACIYSGYWYYLARELRAGLGPWAEARRADGFDVAWRSLEVGGYPLSFRLHFTGATLTATRPFAYSAASADVEAAASPFHLGTWRFRAPEGATIQALVAAAGLAASSLEGSVIVADDATIVAARASAVEGAGAARGFAADTLDLKLTLPQHAPTTDRDPLAAASVSLTAAVLPQAPPPFPRRIDAFALAATLRGAIPPGALADALATWRDGGGTLDIDSAHIVWAKTTIDLDGTLALDQALQPQGALTATVTGADAVVDAIVDAGVLEARYADFAKAVLRAIGRPDEDGADQLHVPVTLQDRRLYVGPAPIAPLPQLKWR
jgi:hypothetical protein